MAGVQVISQAGAQVMLEGRPTENQYIAGQVMFFFDWPPVYPAKPVLVL
jgi:hypothetical protein